MKLNLTFAFICLVVFNAIGISQKVAGAWYGVGTVNRNGNHSSYLSELVLKQTGNKVTGTYSYFFKNASVVTKIAGTFNERTRLLEIRVYRLLNYKARNINGADCPMEGSFTLRVSKIESSLFGQFNPIEAYRYTCPAITAKFVKEVKKPKEIKPVENIKEDNVIIAKPVQEELKFTPPKPAKIDPDEALVKELNKRTFEVNPVIEVDADSLKLTLYDNGEVDGDTISLFYNRKLVAAHQLLKDKPFNITVPLDTSINEISMFAENLGLYPPNTALCIIYANQERFELILTSSFIKNATIRFKKKIKPNGREIVQVK